MPLQKVDSQQTCWIFDKADNSEQNIQNVCAPKWQKLPRKYFLFEDFRSIRWQFHMAQKLTADNKLGFKTE